MLLTITNVSPPATDMGFLLHKNPAAVRSDGLSFGTAHVFYPKAEQDRCTVALLCEVDPVALVRRGHGGSFPLAAYVNDRPYVASSLLSVALRRMFGTAMRGQCRERPELPEVPLELTARLPVLPCRGGEGLLRRLFEPLGYAVSAQPIPLDARFPEWGASPYFDVAVSARCRIRDLLRHLYVLLPVLDGDKHYWVSRDEIGKLVDEAGEWLAAHPERDLIVRRYLRGQPRLIEEAVARLAGEDLGIAELAAAQSLDDAGTGVAERARLREARAAAVLGALKAAGARRVLDLGCGDGRLLAKLLADPQFTQVVGVDAAAGALDRAARRLGMAEMAPRQRARIRLMQGALTYRDRRLAGHDAAVLMEVIEHVEPGRLAALEQAVFAGAAPATVVITTPNADYNVRYPALAAGGKRHPDHRFEWGRAEFRGWAQAAAGRHGYTVRLEPVGAEDPEVGAPTQMAVLTRAAPPAARAAGRAPPP
jgi:3' terminal RNA ribose 2'-O-methyltransferase Hen1